MSVLFLFFFVFLFLVLFFFYYFVNLTCSEVVLPISRISISPFTLHAPGLLQVPDIILEIAACGLEDDLLLVCYSLVYLLTFLLIIIYIVFFFYFYTILYYDTFSIHQHSHCSAYDMQTFSLPYEVKVYEV